MFMSRGTSYLQVTLKFRKKTGEWLCTEERQEGKANVENVNVGGGWVKGPWGLSVLFMQVFCKAEERAWSSEAQP